MNAMSPGRMLIALTLALLSTLVHAADRVHVVATIPDLEVLTEAVGGDLVDVESLTRGTQNVARRRGSAEHDAATAPG